MKYRQEKNLGRAVCQSVSLSVCLCLIAGLRRKELFPVRGGGCFNLSPVRNVKLLRQKWRWLTSGVMLLRLHRRNADETGLGGVHSSPPPLSFRRIWARQIHVDQLPLSDRPVFPWISGSIPSDQADCAGKSRCSQTLGGPEWASVCPSLILRGVADWSPVEAVDSNQVTALCCCYWAERVCLLSLTDCRAAGAFLCFTAFSWWHLWLIWDPPQQSQLPLAENQTALLWMFSPWCHRWDYKQDLTAWLHLKGEVFERRQTWLFRWTLNVKRNRFWAPSVSPLQVKMQVLLLICSTLQMAQFHCSCPFWWTKGRFFRSRCDHIYPIPFPHYLFSVNHAHFRCLINQTSNIVWHHSGALRTKM